MAKMQVYSQKRTLQKNIKRLMDAHTPKMTSQMLADEVGCSRQSIDNYIFDTMPNAAALQSIADYFNVSTDGLLGRPTEKDDETAFLLRCSEYTGLSMDAIKVLHFWNTQMETHAINDKYSYETQSPFLESKEWLNLLSLMICTDAGSRSTIETDKRFMLISSIYEYVTFQADDCFTLFKANKTDDGYSPEAVGVFKSDELYMADKHGMRSITTELMKEAMRKYINDTLDELANLIQGSPIKK